MEFPSEINLYSANLQTHSLLKKTVIRLLLRTKQFNTVLSKIVNINLKQTWNIFTKKLSFLSLSRARYKAAEIHRNKNSLSDIPLQNKNYVST